MLLVEVLYMEVRIFRQFLERFKMRAVDAYSIFDNYDIWGYIESCYDVLHMNGDEYVLNDVQQILSRNSDRAVSFAIEELLPNQLEDQYCFLTQKAVDSLEFQEARRYAI